MRPLQGLEGRDTMALKISVDHAPQPHLLQDHRSLLTKHRHPTGLNHNLLRGVSRGQCSRGKSMHADDVTTGAGKDTSSIRDNSDTLHL